MNGQKTSHLTIAQKSNIVRKAKYIRWSRFFDPERKWITGIATLGAIGTIASVVLHRDHLEIRIETSWWSSLPLIQATCGIL